MANQISREDWFHPIAKNANRYESKRKGKPWYVRIGWKFSWHWLTCFCRSGEWLYEHPVKR